MTGGICLCRLVPPSIRGSGGASPLVVNTRAGTSLTLRCESSAVPPPNITWYKNGRPVTESANLRVLKERQMLEIQTTRVKLRSCTSPVLLHAEKCLMEGLRSGSYFPVFDCYCVCGFVRCPILDSMFAKQPTLQDKWTRTSI